MFVMVLDVHKWVAMPAIVARFVARALPQPPRRMQVNRVFIAPWCGCTRDAARWRAWYGLCSSLELHRQPHAGGADCT